MQLPFFYTANYDASQKEIVLDEDTSRHVIQVLRMQKGQQIILTDGKGTVLTTSITGDHKKHCTVQVDSFSSEARKGNTVTIGISLVKNNNRFEWFLEKATEIGITQVIPLICERTEKQKFRSDRMHSILVSAMLQSRQSWLPILHEPIDYKLLFRQEEVAAIPNRFIAHCIDENRSVPVSATNTIILIGPEGDFTMPEIELAIANHFVPVTLGETRLRTETAAIVAATLLKIA
jgi:16S rRNA (uracil1498-N3)-methyltransferase